MNSFFLPFYLSNPFIHLSLFIWNIFQHKSMPAPFCILSLALMDDHQSNYKISPFLSIFFE